MADAAAVTFLLEQVTGVIKGYVDLISGADQKEFDKLMDKVEELKNILQDTANKLSEDLATISTKNKIREFIFDVENEIDTWLTEAKAANKKSKHVKSLGEEKMKDILEKANKMKIDLQSIGPSKEEEDAHGKKDPPIRREKVVGLEDEERILKGYLRTDQSGLDIIPVIGMPGLGKTTLAWKIYNDEQIRYEFPIRIWVHFSQRFNSKEVLIQIMKTFTSNMEELNSMTTRELCDAVHTCLLRDKFLLVVDDVWKRQHWDEIKEAFPYSNAYGKVMITSREMEVGMHVQQITEPYLQRPLDDDQSWELLELEVFGNTGCHSDELKGIGKLIAKRCRGIPLKIEAIGGVLKQHLSLESEYLIKEKWIEVATNDDRPWIK